MGNDGSYINRGFGGCRIKKLVAGIWFSLYLSDTGDNRKGFNCNECPERRRENRNCHNRKGLLADVVFKDDWKEVGPELAQHEVQKVNEIKFYQCPISFITKKTWQILQLVNDTTDGDCNIMCLPFPGGYYEQPGWYKHAVRIVRGARAENQRIKMARK